MKKAVVSLALVLGLGATQVIAQNVSGGIKAEANMSNFILKDIDGTKSNMGFGATIGGFGNIQFTENFALQPELLLHFKNSELKNETGEKADFQYFGIEIPVYAVGQTELWGGKGYLGLGPYVGFGIDAKYKPDGASDINLYKNEALDNKMQRWDFGAGAMLGYEFSNRIQINAGYKLGFINALDSPTDNASMINQTVSLGLGYRF